MTLEEGRGQKAISFNSSLWFECGLPDATWARAKNPLDIRCSTRGKGQKRSLYEPGLLSQPDQSLITARF
jgi:hypothetical protein